MPIERFTSDVLDDFFRKRDEEKVQGMSRQMLTDYMAQPEPVASEPAPQRSPLLDTIKGFARSVAPTQENIAQAIRDQGPLSRARIAGAGDVAASIGGGIKWLGGQDLGAGVSETGRTLQELGEDVPKGLPYDIARALPSTEGLMLGGLLAGSGGAAAGAAAGLGAVGQGVTGTIAAVLASRPVESLMEAGGTYDESLQRSMAVGLPSSLAEEQADKAAKSVFLKNMALSGMDVAELVATITPLKGFGPLLKTVTKTKLGQAAVQAGRVAGVAGLEAGEEGLQEVFQRQALGDPIALDEQMKKSMLLGGIMGGGMGAVGAAADIARGAGEAPAVDTTPSGSPLLDAIQGRKIRVVRNEQGFQQKPPEVAAGVPGEPVPGAELAPGSIIYDPTGRPLEVIDATSDPSSVRVRGITSFGPGAETSIGRKMIRFAPPEGIATTVPTTPEEQVTPAAAPAISARPEMPIEERVQKVLAAAREKGMTPKQVSTSFVAHHSKTMKDAQVARDQVREAMEGEGQKVEVKPAQLKKPWLMTKKEFGTANTLSGEYNTPLREG